MTIILKAIDTVLMAANTAIAGAVVVLAPAGSLGQILAGTISASMAGFRMGERYTRYELKDMETLLNRMGLGKLRPRFGKVTLFFDTYPQSLEPQLVLAMVFGKDGIWFLLIFTGALIVLLMLFVLPQSPRYIQNLNQGSVFNLKTTSSERQALNYILTNMNTSYKIAKQQAILTVCLHYFAAMASLRYGSGNR